MLQSRKADWFWWLTGARKAGNVKFLDDSQLYFRSVGLVSIATGCPVCPRCRPTRARVAWPGGVARLHKHELTRLLADKILSAGRETKRRWA